MSSKPTIYWDACMFYEVLGDENVPPDKKAGAKEILDANDKNENIIVTSVITHLEVLPTKLAGKSASDEEDYIALFDGIKFGQIELNANIIMRAREIRDFYYVAPDANNQNGKMMDLGDAIHLATATIHNVNEFHTRDEDQKGSKVPLLKLYEMSNNPKVCGRYDLLIKSPISAQGALELNDPNKK